MAKIRLVIYIIAVFALRISASAELNQETEAVARDRVNWIYIHSDSQKFYLNSSLQAVQNASNNQPEGFDVLLDGDETRIQIVADNLYANIFDSKLTPSTVGGQFHKVYLPIDPNLFHLLYNDTNNGIEEFLVTPLNRPPFAFYLKSRYPGIREAAVFNFVQARVDLEELYNSSRANTRKTLEAIRGSTDGKMEQYYMELINLTKTLLHWEGRDIFLIASFIKTDLGIDSIAFHTLPQQVQNLIGYNQLYLTHYSTNFEQECEVVNSTFTRLDLSTLVYPYTFTFNESTGWWSIKVHNRVRNTWFIDYNFVSHRDSLDDRFVFLIYLKLDIPTLTYNDFEIHITEHPTASNGKLFVKRNQYRKAFFYTFDDEIPEHAVANFSTRLYNINVLKLYSNLRENIHDTLDLISSFATDKAAYYEILLDRMYSAGHIAGGSDVFSLGLFIRQDLGLDSYLFGYLPRQVELLLREHFRLAFYYRHNSTNSYPFKYYYASDLNTDVASFQFTFSSNFYIPTVAITYDNLHQLILDSNSNLIDELSTELKFLFKIETAPNDASAFNIITWKSVTVKHALLPKSTAPDYFFDVRYTITGAQLTVGEYEASGGKP